jgi:hydroxymethylpyrimidine pyrophosphatase-like HAD family hydrolase
MIEQDKNPYKSSTALEKIARSKKIAVLDIDSTITGNPDVAEKIRHTLSALNYAVVFATSRTEEMLMSEASFAKTPNLHRLPPKLGMAENGHKYYAPPESINEIRGLIDPDSMAAGTGTRILLRQSDGSYAIDTEFEKQFGIDSPDTWRKEVMDLLAFIDPGQELYTLAPPEIKENYERDTADIMPPLYRVQLEFGQAQAIENTGSTNVGLASDEARREARERKRAFIEKSNALHTQNVPANLKDTLSRLHFIDDSNPSVGRYVLFITPKQASKEIAISRLISNLCSAANVSETDLTVLFAGDSYPDVDVGLYCAPTANAYFILASGSRLTDVFTDLSVTDFSDQDFTNIKSKLSGDPKNGILDFKISETKRRKIFIGDTFAPGTSAPESVLKAIEYVESEIKETNIP